MSIHNLVKGATYTFQLKGKPPVSLVYQFPTINYYYFVDSEMNKSYYLTRYNVETNLKNDRF